MTDLRTAAQQAIALICSARLCEVNSMSSRQEMLRLLIEATDLLRAALAEADEPVAWAISYDGKTPYRIFSGEDCYLLDEEVRRQGGATCKLPLYTHPPRREPLDDWAIETIAACCVKGDKSVEWALRAVERAHGIGTEQEAAPYGMDCSPEPRREPVAWLYWWEGVKRPIASVDKKNLVEQSSMALFPGKLTRVEPLYTHPPRHEPLTEDEVRRLYRGAWTPESEANEVLAFARAVERAHGIGTDE